MGGSSPDASDPATDVDYQAFVSPGLIRLIGAGNLIPKWRRVCPLVVGC